MLKKSVFIASAVFLFASVFGQMEKDVLFHVSFNDVINAEKAIGSQECKASKEVQFVPGVQGKAVRLVEGNRLTYDIEKNVDVKKGTVVFWMRAVDWDPAKQSKKYHWLFSMEKNGPGGSRIQFFRMPSSVFMYMIGPTGKALQLTNSGKKWKQGEWNCIVMTWGEGRAMLFINGKGIAAPKLPPESCPVDIGKTIQFYSSCGTTDYDDLVIYNRPLTPGEIESIYLEKSPATAQKKNYKPRAVIGQGAASDWNSAVKIAGFLSIPELQTIPGTEIRASYGKKSLFFHFESPLKPGKYQKPAVVTRRSLWDVPCAEIFLRTGTGEKCKSYQLGFNMYGQKLTLINAKEIPWEVMIKTEIKGQKWIADIEIPYKSLNAKPPVPGDEWLMNFGRKFIKPDFFSNPAVTLAYGNADKWWRIGFTDKPGVYADVNFDREKSVLKYSLHNTGKTDQFSILVKKLPMDLQRLAVNLEKVETIPGIIIANNKGTKPLKSSIPFPGAGRYLVLVKVNGKNGALKFQQLFHFVQKESFAIEPVFLSKDKLMNVQCLFNFPVKNKTFLKAEILNKAGKVVAKQEGYAEKDSLKKTFQFDMSSWKELDYRVRVSYFENDKKTEERTRDFKCFYNAPWNGFEKTIGYMEKIPAPWIPLKVSGSKITTLSQVYELGEDGLPAKVSAIGKDILAGKIRLDLTGFKQTSKLRFLRKDAGLVVWQTEFASATAKAVLKGAMEFDGMIRYDLTITPEKKTVLKNLKLTIPASKKFGKYFIPYDGPYQNWTVLTMKNDAAKPYSDAFMPHLWTGGDDAGIAWFAESEEFYNPADERKVVAISPTEKSTDMIIDMVGKDLKLEKAVTYTFGIQATPSKPMPDKWFNWYLGSCGKTNRRPIISAGFTTGPEYHVYSGIPYPTQNDDRVKHYVKTYRKANLFPLLHATTNGLGGKCPEFQFFEQEWKNSNFCDTWAMAARGEYYWGINTNMQSYRDFFLWNTKKAIDKFEPDGFFYDFASVFEVNDPAGNCTYMKNGQKRMKWPIFSDRAIRRAVYQMVQDKGGKAIFIFHNYSKPFVPILSFATMILDGEPYQQRTGVIGVKVTSDYTKLIPISRFRSMFGVQFGVIPYFLIRLADNDNGTPEYTKATRTLFAMALPHAVPVWGFYCDIAELNAVLKIQDKFKIAESEFYSCFSEKRTLKLLPEKKDKVLMGYWEKKNGDRLIAVGNLTGQPYSGKILIPGHKALEIKVPEKDFLLFAITKDGTPITY